jgi:hypothetical protein
MHQVMLARIKQRTRGWQLMQCLQDRAPSHPASLQLCDSSAGKYVASKQTPDQMRFVDER